MPLPPYATLDELVYHYGYLDSYKYGYYSLGNVLDFTHKLEFTKNDNEQNINTLVEEYYDNDRLSIEPENEYEEPVGPVFFPERRSALQYWNSHRVRPSVRQ